MIIAALQQVIVPESRQRQSFSDKKLKELEESIHAHGLLHPITVTPTPTGQYILRAGECRFRAITKLADAGKVFRCDGVVCQPGDVPVLRTTEMDPIALEELELDENLRRQALTPQEEVKALARIMAMRKARDPEVTTIEVAQELSAATGQEVSTSRKNLAQAQFVAEHINDPAIAGKLANARSTREMYSIAAAHVQNEFQAALRERVGATTEHACLNGDCLTILPTFPEGQFDCIIADPPYGVSADEFGTAGPSHEYTDTPEAAYAIADCILREGFRISKPGAHLYLFCDIDFFHVLRDRAVTHGWTAFRTPLIWDKGGGAGHNPIPAQAIRRSYELILFCCKGDRPALKMISDVIRDIPNVRQSIHAAEKPGRLYEHLLSRSCKAGDTVLDPTCGVGPVFASARALRLRATGIEKDPQFFQLASQRRFGEPSQEGQPEEPPNARDAIDL